MSGTDTKKRKQPPGEAKKKDKKDAPKRAKSSYFLFCDVVRPQIMLDNPKMKMSDVSKVMSERWAGLDPVEKAKYDELGRQEKIKFDSTQPDHLVTLPKGWKREVDATSKLAYYMHIATKVCQWTKPTQADPVPVAVQPPRPAFALFSADLRAQTPAVKLVAKDLSVAWKEAAPDVKARFEKLAKDDKERYTNDRISALRGQPFQAVGAAPAPLAAVVSAPLSPNIDVELEEALAAVETETPQVEVDHLEEAATSVPAAVEPSATEPDAPIATIEPKQEAQPMEVPPVEAALPSEALPAEEATVTEAEPVAAEVDAAPTPAVEEDVMEEDGQVIP